MIVCRAASYSVVAATCAALHVAILVAGDAAGVHYVLSTTMSFVACVVVGYALHCRWTFGTAPVAAGLWRYAAAMSLNLPMSLVAVWLFHVAIRLPMAWAAPMSTVALTAVNYLLARWAILPREA